MAGDGGTTAEGMAGQMLAQIQSAMMQQPPAGVDAAYAAGFFARNRGALLTLLQPVVTQLLSLAQQRAQAAPAQASPPTLPELWSVKQRTEANIAAMQLLGAKEPHELTTEDRAVLSAYSGWGGLSLRSVQHRFPRSLPVPEERGLIHEYYTPTVVTREIARVIAPLLDGLAGGEPEIHALEPAAGIGRFLRAFQGSTFDRLRWHACEWSELSGRMLAALFPGIDLHIGPFERWAHQHGGRWQGRLKLVVSNPPYGARGGSISDDPDRAYREKMAYPYFLRRSLDLLAPGGLGVFLIPSGFLSGKNALLRGLREKVLKRHHLSAAFRLPSVKPGGGEAIFPGAMLVTDLLFFRARGGELDAVDGADQEILEGDYFKAFPAHILGREMGKDGGEDDQTVKPRWGYQVQGIFTKLPDFEERAICADCRVTVLAAKGSATKGVHQGVVRFGVDAATEGLAEEVAGAVRLGARVDRYLSMVAAQVPYEPGMLWRELHDALLSWVQKNGTPGMHRGLTEAARLGNNGAQRFLGAFDKAGNLLPALQVAPEDPPPIYNGSPDDAIAQAELLYRQNRGLTVAQLHGFHEDIGGRLGLEQVLMQVLRGGWFLDGDAWDRLVPSSDYLTGNLWERHDRIVLLEETGFRGAGKALPERLKGEQAAIQKKALIAAIKPAVFEEIDGLSPRQGWVPLGLVQGWMEEQWGSYGNLERARGVVQMESSDYEDEGGIPARWSMVLGWINHDKTLFRPSVSRGEDLDQKRLELAKEWDASFRAWVTVNGARVAEVVRAYNRQFRGYVLPDYSAESLPIARWKKDGPRLRHHQIAGARRVLANRGGLVAFDVGVGKTYTGLAILARARQEGWAKRPVILVPNSIVWKWYADIQRVLPDFRIAVIGSKPKVMQRGERKGQHTSETDTPKDRAEKWTRFQGGEYDVALLTYSALPRTRMNAGAVEAYAASVSAIQREITLRKRNAKKRKTELTERQQAVLNEGVMGWVSERMELPESWEYDPGPAWDDIGIDLLILDEAQNFKNLYAPAEREGGVPRFMGNAGEGSDRAWQLDFRCAAVRRKTGGNGIVLLSATPAKNSPLEFYNLLQYIDPAVWTRMGIGDPEQFIDRYIQTEIKSVMNTRMEIEDRSAAVGFKNLHELREVIFRYGEFKTAEEVGLVLPEPKVEMVEVDMNAAQEAKYARYVAEIAEAVKDYKQAGKVLGLLARLSLVSIHPALDEGFDWKNAGNVSDPSSPKFAALAERVLLNRGCGHIVFVDNVAAHRWVRDVLVKRGIPVERIAILNAEVAKAAADRQQIARDFNGDPDEERLPKYDVVIANAIAYEGIDLQTRTCAIHHLDLPWEPATLQQRNGRGVRQGNTLGSIAIYYYFARRSQDGLRFNLIQGKRGWMTQVLKSQDRATNNPGAQMDMGPEETLLLISRNPEETRKRLEAVRAKREEEARKKLAEEANRSLRALNARYRHAERVRDPEEAKRLRAEAEARLEQLLETNPEAWPWAGWIGVVRERPVLIADGSGPVFEGLRLAIPNPYNPAQVNHVEFGRVKTDSHGASVIGWRVAGQATWEGVSIDGTQLKELKPEWYDAQGWPVDDMERSVAALRETVDRTARYSGFQPTRLLWHLAPEEWAERMWGQVSVTVFGALRRGWNQYGLRQQLPGEVNGKFEVTNSGRLTPDQLMGPTGSGWRRFLSLAPASGLKFSELQQIGMQWWGRQIPRNLLTAGRTTEGGEGEEEEGER